MPTLYVSKDEWNKIDCRNNETFNDKMIKCGVPENCQLSYRYNKELEAWEFKWGDDFNPNSILIATKGIKK